MEEKADILLKSKYKNNQYYMYSDKIIIKNNNNEYCIRLPQIDKVIGFYDMYYINQKICVIIATRGSYDIRCILDEEELKLTSEQLSK